MNLTIDGSLYKFYRWTYGYAPPNNLCPFFWGLLWATVIFPITWWTYPWEDVDWDGRLVGGMFMWGIAIGIGFLTGSTLSGWYDPILVLGIVSAIGIAAILTGVIIIAGGSYLLDTASRSEMKTVFVETKKSWQEKYCPKITWR